MGQHTWLLMATICTELLCILKWSKGQFEEPFPRYVKFFWSIGGTVLVAYPIIKVSTGYCLKLKPELISFSKFGIPKMRRYLRRNAKIEKEKTKQT
jgi:phosphatidylserine synthase 2